MDPSVQLLIAAVVATAEFCAAPIDRGIGEPQFCRIYASQEISTPFFSIVVEPDFLVGVHQQGRRLQVQSSLSQSQNHLSVEVIEGSALPSWPDCPEISETIDDNESSRQASLKAAAVQGLDPVFLLRYRSGFGSRSGAHAPLRANPCDLTSRSSRPVGLSYGAPQARVGSVRLRRAPTAGVRRLNAGVRPAFRSIG